MDAAELRAAVTREFATTGAATPRWPDPHPERDAPDDTYSRCLEPQKYSIVGARVSAWVNVLVGAGLATREAPSEAPALRLGSTDSRARLVLLRPTRTGAVPLVFAMYSSLAPDDVVVIGAGDPPVEVERVPDCYCDHCDSGSDDLLAQIDDTIVPVVDGRFVHITGPDWMLRTTDIGWAAHGEIPGRRRGHQDAQIDMIRDVLEGRSPYPVVHGAAWW